MNAPFTNHQADIARDTRRPEARSFYRHTALVRLTHWVNALAIFVMIGTGLNIFNAHPMLYWGQKGSELDAPFIALTAIDTPHGMRGDTLIGPFHIDTTGFLGLSDVDGQPMMRGWPNWLTLPSATDLADARHWHFFFAWILVVNGLVYLAWSFSIRHVQRDLWPTLADLRAIPRSVLDHLKLKHPTGEAAKRYNVLQRLAYLGAPFARRRHGADRLLPVARIGRLRPLARAAFRRAAVRENAAFPVRGIDRRLHRRPPGRGGAGRPAQRDPLDDHRTLCPAQGTRLTWPRVTRRDTLAGALAGSGLLLSGCSRILSGNALNGSPSFQGVLAAAQGWTLSTQRFLLSGGAMAQEFKISDLSPHFKANGTLNPGTDDYDQQVEENFAHWRLIVDGLVRHPLSLSVADLRRLPSRTQITRHDCVEGWSAIGQWTGTPLALILKAAEVQGGAKYAVFHCADNLGGEPSKGGAQSLGQYYESLDLIDAVHPQTADRLRHERQATGHRPRRGPCVFGWSDSSATSRPNTFSASRSSIASAPSPADRAAIGRIAAMSGTRESEPSGAGRRVVDFEANVALYSSDLGWLP